MEAAAVVLLVAEVYAGIGLLVAVIFVGYGVGRVDPSAKGAYLFRPLIVPGAALLWPLVLARWRTLARKPAPSH